MCIFVCFLSPPSPKKNIFNSLLQKCSFYLHIFYFLASFFFSESCTIKRGTLDGSAVSSSSILEEKSLSFQSSVSCSAYCCSSEGRKEGKERKEIEGKEGREERKEMGGKEGRKEKDRKEGRKWKEMKEGREGKEGRKENRRKKGRKEGNEGRK